MTKIHRENEEIECPVCKEKHVITFYSSVNAQRNPDLKEKVLNREINTLPCNRTVSIGPFLYVDGNKWIWLYPSFYADREEQIEKEIRQQEVSSKQFFGNNSDKIHYVFGYDNFLNLLMELESAE